MRKWKKSFRKIPTQIQRKIIKIDGDNLKILAGKVISQESLAEGEYQHLGLTTENTVVGSSFEVMPPSNCGTSSKRNQDGWETVRKDLPKKIKYFYHDIQNFGDGATYGWSTVSIPREVYEKDVTPPYLFHIEVNIQEQNADGSFGIVFSIDEVFLKTANNFEVDLLFAINLLQENTGVADIVAAEDPQFVFSSQLQWDVFPPGNLDEVVSAVSQPNRYGTAPEEEEVRERFRLFEQFEPIEYLKGLGGNDHYIGAKYADDLVVFENLKHGNALYVLYGEWEELSRMPRSELLKLKSSQFDRIIHKGDWQNIFAVLMQNELQQRGKRINIGRHMRRRR